MEQHKRQGSLVGDATVQHRMCHLCAEPGYYFNNDALATHCKEAHISCYVCNSQTIFFIDQPSLVEHVVEQHICCPECQQTSGQVRMLLLTNLTKTINIIFPPSSGHWISLCD